MDRISYNTKTYNFKKIIEDWLDVEDLTKLHLIKQYNHFDREHDQSTIWHEKFYKLIRTDNTFRKLYKKFLEDIIKPKFKEAIVYQHIPTFRVHLPNNVAVGEFHKDKDYRNKEWAEEVTEVNYYLPLTDVYDTNTIWVESREDKGDFKPINAYYGECVEWDGSNLTHGNKDNKTGQTRVSFDFRVMPKSKYIESKHTSINTNTPFSIGGYYEEI